MRRGAARGAPRRPTLRERAHAPSPRPPPHPAGHAKTGTGAKPTRSDNTIAGTAQMVSGDTQKMWRARSSEERSGWLEGARAAHDWEEAQAAAGGGGTAHG